MELVDHRLGKEIELRKSANKHFTEDELTFITR